MTLDVAVRHRRGDFTLELAFRSEARITALFGPSGSGKSTLLNVIAGLIAPDEARIVIDGRVLADTKAGIAVPVHRRRVGYVFQDARLFPHLTVARNLLYGRWFTPRPERYGSFREVVDLLGIRPLLGRRPATLSGGERQRVAIGRALLASPGLLLMDEPLASLDAARKAETLPYLERLRDELSIPMVYVSHSLDEVRRLTHSIVYLEDGRLAPPLPFAPEPLN
jgi:molybdate transport system ATP-binding protein